MGSGFSGKYAGTFYYSQDYNIDHVSEEINFGDIRETTIYENALKAKEKFGLDKEGYFAQKTKSSKVREFVSDDPIGDSKELYEILSNGGVRDVPEGLKGESKTQ